MSEGGTLECDDNSQKQSESPQSVRTEDFDGLFDSEDRCAGNDISSSGSTEQCSHPGYMAGMCIRCGADKLQNEETSLLPFGYIQRGLEFSKEEAARVSAIEASKAECERKLQLVLDLDHTLLHSAQMDYAISIPSVREWMLAEEAAHQENNQWKCSLRAVPACFSVTKLRPGVFTFLEALRPLFNMCIYTMGEETYALQMAQLLDPDGSFFQRKVISREHSLKPDAKNLDIVMGLEHATVIVDDTWQVWTQHQSNLITISKYCFFPTSSSDQPALRGWLDLSADEIPQTNDLAKIQSILETLHASFFELPEASRDVRVILRKLLSRKRNRSDDS